MWKERVMGFGSCTQHLYVKEPPLISPLKCKKKKKKSRELEEPMVGVVDVWISLFSTVFFLLQFGRTEVIDNTLNPDFVRKYILDYFFEEKQNLRFDLWVLFFEIKNEWMNEFCLLSSI